MATFNLFWANNGAASNQLTTESLNLVQADLLRNGVVLGSEGQGTAACQVTQNDGLSLSVAVNPGDWMLNGVLCAYAAGQSGGNANSSGQYVLGLLVNASAQPRTDRVIAQLDLGSGLASYAVVTGIPGKGAPTINTNPSVLQISLAQVAVAAGATAITGANITDERFSVGIGAGSVAAPQLHSAVHLAGASDALLHPEYPEGSPLAHTGWLTDMGEVSQAANSTYTVPSGKTLYITRFTQNAGYTLLVQQSGGTAQLALDGGLIPPWPICVGAGGVLSTNTSAYVWSWAGMLMRAAGKASYISQAIATGGTPSTYTTPAGAWFVLQHIYASTGITLTIGGDTVIVPGFTSGGQTVGLGGTGALVSGMNVFASGMYVPSLPRPLLLSPGTAITCTTTGNAAIHGFSYPQGF